VGAHRLRFEEPDLVMAELIGPVGMGDAKELVRVLREIGASRPYYFCGDVSRSTIKGEARRYVGEGMSEAWLKGRVYYGVGPGRVGPTRLRFEGPYLVWTGSIGPVGMGDAKEWVRVRRKIGASRPSYFCGDWSRSTIKGEARRYVGEGMSEAWLKGLIYYGVG